jgi:hypothetical protein
MAATLAIGAVLWAMADSGLPRINVTTSARDGAKAGRETPATSEADGWSRAWRIRHRAYGEPEDSEETTPHQAVRAGPQSGETTPHWNSLPSAERVARLEHGFDTALDEFRAGDFTAASRAATALSALRSELYATPEGRERHAELEQQLDSLTKD